MIRWARMSPINLPKCCGVMLLPDCTLFPHGGLPLHLFEPRYRQMLADSLEGDCLFAVTRLVGAELGNVADYACGVGTIGLIRAARVAEDGSSHTLLHGVLRVRFTRWLDEKPYPFAEIEPVFAVFEPEHQAAAAMKTIRGAVEDAVTGLPAELRANVLAILDRADEPGLMTDIVCQQFVQDPDLRQRLLEMESIGARIPLICDYLSKISLSPDE